MFDATALQEQRKYERMYDLPIYRQNSPGHRYAREAVALLGMEPGESIVDYGCGLGRATRFFADMGMDALGVEFAANAPEDGTPYVLANLWGMGDEVPAADYAYCCDVMEHVPVEHVDDVLRGIAERTRKGGFFNVSTGEDVHGRIIGEELHITRRDAGWWDRRMGQFFRFRHGEPHKRTDLVYIVEAL